MSRRRSSRTGSALSLFVLILVVMLVLGALASWTPLPDGLIGFLAVMCVAFGFLGSGGRSRRRRVPVRRAYYGRTRR